MKLHSHNPVNPLPDKAAVIYIITFAFICLISNIIVSFHQTHNDFWDVYFIARHMTFADGKTLFNPQYPIGSCLFLKAIMGHFPPEIPGIISNIFFCIGLLTASWLLFRRIVSGTTALFSLIAFSLFPRLFHYCTMAGGDPASIAFFAFGAFFILSQLFMCEKKRWVKFFVGGIFLGLGALFRYHIFVGAVLFLIALAIVYWRHWKLVLLSVIGLGIGYCPQFILNIATGHGLLETQFGMMNVLDLMYGLTWYQTSSLNLPPSILSAIAHDPMLFLRKYIGAFMLLSPAYAPAAIAFFICKEPAKRKLSFAIGLWTICYCGFFASTTSGRSILLPLSLSFLCVGIASESLLKAMSEKISKSKIRLISFGCVGLILLGFFAKDALFVRFRHQENRVVSTMENYLHGIGCKEVMQIFSTDFLTYFRTMPFYMPYFNGGCPRWGTYLYNEEYPEFPVETLPLFFAECQKRKVRFVLLIKQCAQLSPALGRLYAGKTAFPGVVLKKEIGRFKIFEVE
jgi:hypothetical protein